MPADPMEPSTVKHLPPITEIKGSFGSVEEVRYHGGYLPVFPLKNSI